MDVFKEFGSVDKVAVHESQEAFVPYILHGVKPLYVEVQPTHLSNIIAVISTLPKASLCSVYSLCTHFSRRSPP